MPFSVMELLEKDHQPLTVTPDQTVREALTIMIDHNFSQLPVVDLENKQKGIVTQEYILEALRILESDLDDLFLSNVTKPAAKFRPEDRVFDILEKLRDSYAALIVDRRDHLIGIVTVYDAMEFFRQHSEDMMRVRDIELAVRDHIQSAFLDPDGKPDELQLLESINEIVPGPRRANYHRFRNAIVEYIRSTLDDEPEINQDALEKSLTIVFGKDKQKTFEELTLYEYSQVLLHPSQWPRHKVKLDIPRDALRKLLDKVRDIRNDLAHFKSELTAEQRRLLRYCVDRFEAHRPPLRLTSPLGLGMTDAAVGASVVREEIAEYSVETPSEQELVPGEEELSATESRYAPLAIWLQNVPEGTDEIQLTFSRIEQIIDDDLPASARKHRAWWANDPVGHSHAVQWLDIGWKTYGVDVPGEELYFMRVPDRERAYISFYSRLSKRLRSEAKFSFRERQPKGANWHVVGQLPRTGARKAVLGFAFTRSKQFRVELYIDTGDRQQNKAIFDYFHGNRETIEKELGEPISWERIDDRRASRIAIYEDLFITDSSEKLDALIDWAVRTMNRLYEALIPLEDEAFHTDSVMPEDRETGDGPDADPKNLEQRFHAEMISIYERARKECNYNATRFIQMVSERGGVKTARLLLASNAPQEGFTRLWECGRLDLTVEALVSKPEFASLFTDAEKQVAQQRLRDYGYSLG